MTEWHSLHKRVLFLPDDLAVYPTHGAGSFWCAPAGAERVTTIGAERRHNPLLGAPDEDAFIKHLLGGLGNYPPYFLRMREVNRRGPTVYGTLQPGPLGLARGFVVSRGWSRPSRGVLPWQTAAEVAGRVGRDVELICVAVPGAASVDVCTEQLPAAVRVLGEGMTAVLAVGCNDVLRMVRLSAFRVTHASILRALADDRIAEALGFSLQLAFQSHSTTRAPSPTSAPAIPSPIPLAPP